MAGLVERCGVVPTREQLDTAEWTMECFAGLYNMRYEGMASNAAEATRLATRVRQLPVLPVERKARPLFRATRS